MTEGAVASADNMASTWREPVRDDWIDYNGHLSEAYYVLVFGHATDEVMEVIGLGPQAREASGTSLYTLEAHVRYLDEVAAESALEVRTWVVGVAAKAVRLWHELWVDGRLRATEEILAVHVDASAGRATAFPDDLARRLAALTVVPPEHAGRAITLR